MLAEKGVTDITVRRLGIHDEFVEHATQAELRSKYGLDEDGIYRAAKEMLGKKPSKIQLTNSYTIGYTVKHENCNFNKR